MAFRSCARVDQHAPREKLPAKFPKMSPRGRQIFPGSQNAHLGVSQQKHFPPLAVVIYGGGVGSFPFDFCPWLLHPPPAFKMHLESESALSPKKINHEGGAQE